MGKNLFGEAPSQTISLDDENTPMQEEDEVTQGEGDQIGDASSLQDEEDISTALGEVDHITVKRKRTNVDYRRKNL